MIVYKSNLHNFLIITEKRTCSSFLLELTSYTELVHEPNNPDSQDLLQQILTEYQSGRQIYLVCREPVYRRTGALGMVMSGETLEHKIMNLRGLIQSEVSFYDTNKSRGFINFTLNDSHLDWGTSVYYYVLRAAGIKVNILLADNNRFLDWQDRQWYTSEHLNLFLTEKFDEYNYEYIPKNYMSDPDKDSIISYHAYAKAFREGPDLIPYLDDNATLTFDTWTNLESTMYTRMVSIEHSNFSDQEIFKFARSLLYEVLHTINQYYDQDQISQRLHNYPSRQLLRFYPDINQTLAYLKTDLDIPPLEEHKDPSII